MGSVGAVFNTVELLEQILRGLDFKTLLDVQRINHTFCNTITNSSDLQKKLFKQPVESFDKARKLDMVTRVDVVFSDGDEKKDNMVIGVLNTKALFRPARYRFITVLELQPKKPRNKDQERKIMYKDASWRDMYISQPPMFGKDITIFAAATLCHPFSRERVSKSFIDFHTNGGDKLGKMHSQAQQAAQREYIGLDPANLSTAWPPEHVNIDVISGRVIDSQVVDCSQDVWFTRAITYK